MGKQIVFTYRPNTSSRSNIARIAMMALFGGLVIQSLAVGGHPLPPSPPPCSPDGVCYPKRDSWGYNATRWRIWPGEDPAVVPTPVDEIAPEPPLPPFDRPEPRHEDLRGPTRPAPVIRGMPVDPAMPAIDPAAPVDPGAPVEPAVPDLPPLNGVPALPLGEEPAQPFEEPELGPGRDDFFPDFNQQGQLRSLPVTDDTPPTLPSGLRHALQNVTKQRAMPSANDSAPRFESPSPVASATGTIIISPVHAKNAGPENLELLGTWDQTGATSIRLVNPAAANIVVSEEDADDQLQQALYIEASDQD